MRSLDNRMRSLDKTRKSLDKERQPLNPQNTGASMKMPDKRRPGRPELPPDERRERTIRIRATEAEEAKFTRIGGAVWFRAALKRAKET